MKIDTTRYPDKGNGLCVLLVTSDGPPFALSMNLHGHTSTDLAGLGEGEFVLRHDIDQGVVAELMAAGLVEDTGKRCSYGYVTGALILRLVPQEKKQRDPLNDPPLLTEAEIEAYARHCLAEYSDEDPQLVRADAGMRLYEMEIGEWDPSDIDNPTLALTILALAMLEPGCHEFWKREAEKVRGRYRPDSVDFADEVDVLLGRMAEAAGSPPPTYTSKNGTVYDLSLRHGMPYDSYGAVTAAAMDGDAEGLARLLQICPREYRGRCDAMLTAAARGDLAVLKVLLPEHEGEEISAYRVAAANGRTEAAALIRERMAALGKLDQLAEEVSR
jgi:hypothetical protein